MLLTPTCISRLRLLIKCFFTIGPPIRPRTLLNEFTLRAFNYHHTFPGSVQVDIQWCIKLLDSKGRWNSQDWITRTTRASSEDKCLSVSGPTVPTLFRYSFAFLVFFISVRRWLTHTCLYFSSYILPVQFSTSMIVGLRVRLYLIRFS